MIYFLLPKTYLYSYKHLQYTSSDEPPTPHISNSLSHYLCDIKKKINDYPKDWDIYKKYTNPYEYIHTNILNKKKSVADMKPLSRSYFKMIEMTQLFKLLDFTTELTMSKLTNNEPKYLLKSHSIPIKTFHLAEGPGGFIEAVIHLRKKPQDIHIGMTILDDVNDFNIPAWKKSNNFLSENPNVLIENGADGTGNILSLSNFEFCKSKYKSCMDLITADGGFDFSFDFNNQEISIVKLLFAQIAYALCMQKKGGHFVLKLFDCFIIHTIDLLYLLSSFYDKVYITKPQTSRYANSEKYIVCKNFLFGSCDEFYPFLHNVFEKMISNNKYSIRFLNTSISNHFLTKIEEFNSIFGQQQIENIYYTISLMDTKYKSEKINNLIKLNIQKSIHWCIKHDIPYNMLATKSNIFQNDISSFI